MARTAGFAAFSPAAFKPERAADRADPSHAISAQSRPSALLPRVSAPSKQAAPQKSALQALLPVAVFSRQDETRRLDVRACAASSPAQTIAYALGNRSGFRPEGRLNPALPAPRRAFLRLQTSLPADAVRVGPCGPKHRPLPVDTSPLDSGTAPCYYYVTRYIVMHNIEVDFSGSSLPPTQRGGLSCHRRNP